MTWTYDFATPTYAAAVRLRQLVLRKPLGLDISNDPLETEYDQIHVGAFDEGQLIGTASLQWQPDRRLKMRQVAVDPEQQGSGVGRSLVAACEAIANSHGSAGLYCHARAEARPFYESCGWRAAGDAFTEVGLEHYKMNAFA